MRWKLAEGIERATEMQAIADATGMDRSPRKSEV